MMRLSLRPALVSALLALLPACGGHWTITPLEMPSGLTGGTRAAALNEHLQVVGWGDLGRSRSNALLWDHGVVTELPTLGGPPFSRALAINERGDIAGASTTATGSPAVIWHAGRIREVAVPGAGLAVAMTLNDDGDVGGYYSRAGATVAECRVFVIENGRFRDLGEVGCGTGFDVAIGKHAQLVSGHLPLPSRLDHAWLWYGSVSRDLGVLPGGTYSSATDLTVSSWPPNADESNFAVVGFSEVPGGSSDVSMEHGFIYTRGRMHEMRTLPGYPTTWPAAINKRHTVVGTASDEHRRVHRAFLYTGIMLDLNDLLPSGSGWVLEYASDINDAGAIVGWGQYRGETRAFLMTPP